MLRPVLALLVCSCLAVSGSAEDNSTKSVDDLAKKVLKAGELQQFGKAAEKVVSSLVKAAPAAELANGDADISTTGACASDRDALCLNVPPGEGRLARCLRTRVQNEERGNVSGRRVTKECKDEIAAFYQDRSTNINKNLQLASACLPDIKEYCGDLPSSPKPGAVLACLRRNQRKLKLKCKLQVTKAKLAAAKDYRADAGLAEKCQADAKRICSDVQPGNGRVQACLREHVLDLDWDCHEELFRQQVENADDIRLSVRLFNACRGDQQRFCKDIPYGANRIKDCLEKHLEDPKFSTECKREFSTMMEQRASDFRLDPALREACSDDIDNICGYQESGLDNVEGYDARVLTCLEDFREDIRGDECKAAVHKMIERQASDYRMDEPLAASCYQDQKTFCASHQPGSARVIRCLQDNRESLSYQCRASLFDLEVRLAEDIDFQFPLKQHCANELTTLCKKVKKGHARVIRCLHRNVGSREMGSECKEEVQRNMNRMAQDYRLNFRLNKACEKDIEATCKNTCSSFLGQACGGTVLRCLQDNVEKLESDECREEVNYFVKMEVTDFRNDVILAETCKQDVDKFCANVEPGDGRVIECLRMHRSELQPACLGEELKLSQQQSRDVRLRPRLMKLCGEEMVVFCKDIKPGSGRVFNCLLEHVQKPNFSSLCKNEVIKREDRVKSDYRLDAGVSTECKDDIDTHCAAEKAAAHGQAGVLRCLADKMVDPDVTIADACEAQMSRAVRMAFWDYKNNTALTLPCDTDVTTYCDNQSSKRSVYTIGVVGRCLTKQLASSLPLSPPCRKLVSVAAPKDIRLYIQETMNRDGTIKMGTMQQVVQKARDASSVITLNGWVAVLSVGCAIFLSIAGGVWLYRRYAGIDKPYTLLVPRDSASSNNGDR